MFNSNSKNNFKALAIGCAAVLICASGQIFASTGIFNNTSYVYAETVSSTYEVKDNKDGTDTGIVHIDTTKLTTDTVTITFKGGKTGATTSGEVGYWDNTAQKWVDKYDSWEEQKFDASGNVSVTVKVPKGVSDVQVMLTYCADWSTGKEVLLDKSSLKTSVESGKSSSGDTTTTTKTPSTTTPTTTTTKTPSTTTPPTSGSNLTIKDTEINKDGALILHVDTTGLTSDTVTVNFTGGKTGATTSGEVGYYDNTTQKWVGKYDKWAEQKFDASGKTSVTVKVPKNVEDVQIMLTYYADWSSGKEEMQDVSTLKATISTSGSVSTGTGSSTEKPDNPSHEMPADAQCGWTDITAGTDNATKDSNLIDSTSATGTKTVTINQGGQWSAYDEGNEPIILDQTWKPEKVGQYDTDRGNDKITNSNNFMFSEDFGMPSDADINHFRFTFQSDDPMYQVQIGAGISVMDECEIANSGSIDEVNNTVKKIWFNESGTYDPTDEDDYAELENANGKKYYGFNSGKEIGEDATGSNYLELQWDVYDDVKPFIKNDSWSSVSVQYWYGVDPRDWDKIDWEDPNHPTDVTKQPEQIDVMEASCNYNLTRTYDYTDTAEKDVDIECFNDMQGLKFSDLGLTEKDQPKAVTFTLSGASDLGKLVGAFGVSVNDDFTDKDKLESANWYQSANLMYEDCGSTYKVTWVIPEDIAKFISPEYDAEVKFGAWYAGSGENTLDSVKITNIAVDYYTEPEVTTTTQITTTTPTPTTTTPKVTTTTPAPTTTTPKVTTTAKTTTSEPTEDIVWGDINCDGQVKSNDLLLLKKYLIGLAEAPTDFPEQGLKNVDVTHDGNVKSNDLLKLKKYLLGLIDDLAPGSAN